MLPEDGPFAWDDEVQGGLRAAYFYGYLLGQLPGALWAERRGAKWMLWTWGSVNVAGTLLTPAAAGAHWGALAALRLLMGLGGAVSFPGMHVMLSAWAPAGRRGVIATLVYAGSSLGTVGATLLGGLLASAVGWEWAFYALGLVALPWIPLWAWLIAERPLPLATPHDLHQRKTFKFPLKAVFTSTPFWAILIAHFCSNCGWYMYLTELPAFMEQVLHKNMKQNALLSALPFALLWAVSVAVGAALDALRSHRVISTGAARKSATALASLVPCACMLGLSAVGRDATAGVALATVAVAASGGMFPGFLANHIDIAHNFAGRLMAITNTIATIPGILMPIIIGELTEGQETLERWSLAFYATALLYALMFLAFTCMGSGEEQPWNGNGNGNGPLEAEEGNRPCDDNQRRCLLQAQA